MDNSKIKKVMMEINRMAESSDNERASKKANDLDALSQNAAGGLILDMNEPSALYSPNLAK